MLKGLVAAGFYRCFCGNGKCAALAGAGTAGLVLGALGLPGLRPALPSLTAFWLLLLGLWSQGKQAGQREPLFLMGGSWLMVCSLGGLCRTEPLQEGLWQRGSLWAGLCQTGSLQAAIATALFSMGALYLLGRGRLYPLWAAALAVLWLLTGFLGSIAYAEPWQGQVMAASLYLAAGGILAFQQFYCMRQNLERAEQEAGAGPQMRKASGGWIESAEREYRQLQIFEHDFRHHLDVIAALYEEGSPEEARAYMEDIKQARLSRRGLKPGGERELSYIMMAKKEACRQAQIVFSYQIVGSPCGIAQMDMTALLLNLLDNAIRACREAPQPRSIGVMLLSRGELWEIEMVNTGRYEPGRPEQGPDLGMLSGRDADTGEKTTGVLRAAAESGRQLHGIGLVSVRQIVEKYQGTYRVWQEAGQVRQKLILVQREP